MAQEEGRRLTHPHPRMSNRTGTSTPRQQPRPKEAAAPPSPRPFFSSHFTPENRAARGARAAPPDPCEPWRWMRASCRAPPAPPSQQRGLLSRRPRLGGRFRDSKVASVNLARPKWSNRRKSTILSFGWVGGTPLCGHLRGE